MKLEYSFRFYRDKIPQQFIDEFCGIEHEPANPLVFAIKINADDPDFSKIFKMWENNPDCAMTPLALNKFSEKELMSAEILYLCRIADTPNEMFANAYGTKYEVLGKYGSNKTYTSDIPGVGVPLTFTDSHELKKQVSPLRINVSKLSKRDIQETFSDEIIISKRLKEILERNNVTGCRYDPVYRPVKIKESSEDVDYYSNEQKLSPDFSQLVVTPECGYSVPPTKFGSKILSLPAKGQKPTADYERECAGYKMTGTPGVGSSFYFKHQNWPNTDFAKTSQIAISEYLHSYLIISQRLYRILKENKVTGFKAEPAYFVD